ncbi:MAG: glycosyltransferase family 4 protein [Thiotrichales bacterium]
MKVLVFVTQFYQLGGAERLSIELVESLIERGYSVDLLSMYSSGLPGVPEALISLERRGIKNIKFLGLSVNPSLRTFLIAIPRLRNLIKQGRYDVIESSFVSPTILASWATLGLQTRLIVGVHQVFRRDRESTWTHRIWRFSLRSNRGICYYAVSNYARRAWVKYLGISEERCQTIYNAIADASFEANPPRSKIRCELGIDHDTKIIIYVGRLAKYKGCDLLLESIAGILNTEDICLLFVGEVDPSVNGSREMVLSMYDVVANRHLEDRVFFLGFRDDVPSIMAEADLLIHPTLMDAFGLAPVEALAAGLPVVTTKVEAIPEILKGSGSIIVLPGDVEGLRAAIHSSLSRSEEEKKLIRNKGYAVAERFRQNLRVDKLLALFTEC